MGPLPASLNGRGGLKIEEFSIVYYPPFAIYTISLPSRMLSSVAGFVMKYLCGYLCGCYAFSSSGTTGMAPF